ncbi:MAG TPA: hypothetical protein VGI74_07175 [Streptosporangiaceae bacterium]
MTQSMSTARLVSVTRESADRAKASTSRSRSRAVTGLSAFTRLLSLPPARHGVGHAM